MCRFLDKDGHCAFHSDDEVKEYCVAGPCPNMQTHNELIDALRETDFGYVCEHCEHEDMCRNNDCVIIQAADAIEKLQAEIDRKDKALQAWVNTWESRKEHAIRHICDHCDTPIEVRLKEGACEDCPIITLVKEIFDDNE